MVTKGKRTTSSSGKSVTAMQTAEQTPTGASPAPEVIGSSKAQKQRAKSAGQPTMNGQAVLPETMAELDEDERLLSELRVDLPGSKVNAISDGMVAIGVGKVPKDTFFRCRPGDDYQPEVHMIVDTAGFDRRYVAVMPKMVEYLRSVKIYTARHRLYWIATEEGDQLVVPVRLASRDGSQNVFSRTLQIAMKRAETEWIRIYNDPDVKSSAARGWEVWPAPKGRFGEPVYADIRPAKIVRVAFKDADNLVENGEHSLVKKWAPDPR
jgi:hypothetical protein